MSAIKLVSMLGSLFVKRSSEDGKIQVAAVPLGALLYTLTGVACYAQSSEPFSQCVERLLPVIGGLF